jgi:hypothetical protein
MTSNILMYGLAAGAGAGLLLVLGYLAYRDADDGTEPIGDGGFKMAPAPVSSGLPGERLLRSWLKSRKKRKALEDGMVRWHLVDDSMSREMYVKPKQKEGGSIPEYEHDGEVYLFPREQLIPFEGDGVWTCFHEKGKAEPIPLKEGNPRSVSAHALKEYLTMRVTSSAPSPLSGLLGDMDAQTLFKYGVLAIAGYAVLMEVTGGGFF